MHSSIPARFQEGGEEWHLLLQGYFESSPIATFVIDLDHRIIVWNRALRAINGLPAGDMIGTTNHWKGFYDEQRPTMADLLLDGALESEKDRVNRLYSNGFRPSKIIEGAYESEGRFVHRDGIDRWLYLTAAPLRDINGRVIGAIETLQDITERKLAEQENERFRAHLEELVIERTRELTELNEALKVMNKRLEKAHNEMLQAEKMASIGHLAAGIAHEINNPLGYVSSNLGTLESYATGLMSLLEVYERSESALSNHLEQVIKAKRDVDLDYIRSDLFELLDESKEGLNRVKKIVQTLKAFSHVGQDGWATTNLNRELDNTLELMQNQIDPGIQVIKVYGDLPEIECLPLQINQVFMDLIQNAVQSIQKEGKIWIRTGIADDQVWVEVADTGCGIPKEHIGMIFDPFFTTKPVGSATGLGLSVAYSVMQKHHGRIEVLSPQQQGATLRLWMPLRQLTTE